MLVTIAVLCLAKVFSDDAVALTLPAVRAEMTTLDDNVTILSLELTHEGGRDSVRLRANLVRPVYFKSRVIYPLGWIPNTEGWYQVNLNATAVLVSPLILSILVLSWPPKTSREFLTRIMFATPFALILFAIDKPLDLLGSLQQDVISQIDPNAKCALFVWAKFLEGGGNSVLALAFSAVAIATAARPMNRSQSGGAMHHFSPGNGQEGK